MEVLYGNKKINLVEIGFGLSALLFTVIIPDEEGKIDSVENAISSVKDVSHLLPKHGDFLFHWRNLFTHGLLFKSFEYGCFTMFLKPPNQLLRCSSRNKPLPSGRGS